MKYVHGLKKVNSAMVAMCGVDENPFANKSFILKLMRMASSHSVDLTAGRFDWKTMGNTVAECLDFAKHDPQTERVWKPITASVYWNLQSLFSGQPVDLEPIASALHELVDIDAGLSEKDKSLWKVLIDFLCKNLQCFINGEPLDLQAFGSLMHRLIDYAKDLTEYDRSALKSCADVIHCLLSGIFRWISSQCVLRYWAG